MSCHIVPSLNLGSHMSMARVLSFHLAILSQTSTWIHLSLWGFSYRHPITNSWGSCYLLGAEESASKSQASTWQAARWLCLRMRPFRLSNKSGGCKPDNLPMAPVTCVIYCWTKLLCPPRLFSHRHLPHSQPSPLPPLLPPGTTRKAFPQLQPFWDYMFQGSVTGPFSLGNENVHFPPRALKASYHENTCACYHHPTSMPQTPLHHSVSIPQVAMTTNS